MDDYLVHPEETLNQNYYNFSCDKNRIPVASEYLNSLGTFGEIFVGLGFILTLATIALAVETSYCVLLQDESKYYKRNCLTILSVYPVASICSLIALSVPRVQLLCEALTQIIFTIAMYRLYLLIIEVGRKKAPTTTTTPMLLRVPPCCCWPCIPFPDLQLTQANLSWLQVTVLQFPIVQTIIYIIFLMMYMENSSIYNSYNIFLQPLCVTSILLALYGLNIAVISLKEVNSEAKLQVKALVTQLVLFFSKLQTTIIKLLPATGLFPCDPPITPHLYANFTCNALMLIEMLLLCYAARYVYREQSLPTTKITATRQQELPQSIATINIQGFDHVKTRITTPLNNNNQQVQSSINLPNVTLNTPS